MSDLNSYVIDFYVTYTNGAAVTTVVSQPPVPTSSSITGTIEQLITYIQTYGINVGNFTMISDSINSIQVPSSSSSNDGTGYNALINQIKASMSSKEALIKNLQELLQKIKADGERMDITTPEMEVPSGTQPMVVGNLKARRTGGQSKVTKFQGSGASISTLETNMSKIYTSYGKFISVVKSAFSSSDSSSSTTTSDQISTSNGTTTSSNSGSTTTNNILNTSGTISGNPSAVENNIVNNIAKVLLGGRRPGTAPRQGNRRGITTTNNTSLSSFQAPVATTVPPTTSTTAQTTDYYEVSTSIVNGLINVLYSYYPANSTTSSYAFTFTVSPKSLSSLSLFAYIKSNKLSTQQKTTIIDTYGYTGSTDNIGMWTSYLIWLFSYLSTGVASQLGLNTIIPFPKEESGAVNYMMDFEYMQKVGNFGLNLQKSTMDSDDAGLLDVSIPYNWPSLMYSFETSKRYGSQEIYMSSSVIDIVKSYTSIPTTST